MLCLPLASPLHAHHLPQSVDDVDEGRLRRHDGIEGIFTYKGFHNVFLPEAVSVAERVQSESWVLGPSGEQVQSEQALLIVAQLGRC